MDGIHRGAFLQRAASVLTGASLAPFRSEFVFARRRYDSGDWDYDWRNKRFLREDNTRFGVNVVVYAMTS